MRIQGPGSLSFLNQVRPNRNERSSQALTDAAARQALKAKPQAETTPVGPPVSFPTYGSGATIVGVAGKPRKLEFEPPTPVGPPAISESPAQPIKGGTAETEPVPTPVEQVEPEGVTSGSVDPIVDTYERSDS